MFKESRFPAKSNEDAGPENGGGVGPLLRASRLRCGEELRDVAQILRIRYPYLEAIEDGRFDDLPGPAYAIGFVRAYAEHLGLDSDEVVRRFKATKSGTEKTHDLVFPSPIPEGGIPGGAVLFVGIIVAVLAYGGWYVSSSKDVSFADLIPPLPERLAELLPGVDPEPPETASPETVTQDATTAEAAPAVPVPAPVPEAAAPEPAPIAPIAVPVAEAPVATPPTLDVAEIAEPPAPPVEPAAEPPAETPPQPAVTEVPPTPEQTVAAVEAAPSAVEPEVTAPEIPSVVPPPPPPPPPNRPEAREFSGVSEGQSPPPIAARAAESPPPATPQAAEAPPEAQPQPAPTPQPAQTAETELPPPAEAEEARTVAVEEPRPQTETDDADLIRPGTAISEEDAAGTDSQLAAVPQTSTVPAPGSRTSRVYGGDNEDSRILVRAKLDSWIQVRDDSVNRLLLTRLLRAGDIYRVPDRPGLKLLTGNAGALEILVDGEVVPSIGPPGRVRRDVPLDAKRLRDGTAAVD